MPRRVDGWLSPTGLVRMMNCLASSPSSAQPMTTQPLVGNQPNLGMIAHGALERWVDLLSQGGGRPGGGIRSLYETIGQELGVAVNRQAGGRELGIRLGRLEFELTQIIDSDEFPVKMHPELVVEDKALGLRGVCDLVVVGRNSIRLFEYKTGRATLSADGSISESVLVQMEAYALLLENHFKGTSLQSYLVNIHSGIHVVTKNEVIRNKILAKIQEYRLMSHLGEVLPRNASIGNCRHCSQRLHCEDQWDEAREKQWSDVVEGRLVYVSTIKNGSVALLLEKDGVKRWLIGVKTTHVRGPLPSMGSYVLAVRVSRVGVNEGRTISYRTNSGTQISCS